MTMLNPNAHVGTASTPEGPSFIVLFGEKFSLHDIANTDTKHKLQQQYSAYVRSKSTDAGLALLCDLVHGNDTSLTGLTDVLAKNLWKEASSRMQYEIAQVMAHPTTQSVGEKDVWQDVWHTLRMEDLANEQMKTPNS